MRRLNPKPENPLAGLTGQGVSWFNRRMTNTGRTETTDVRADEIQVGWALYSTTFGAEEVTATEHESNYVELTVRKYDGSSDVFGFAAAEMLTVQRPAQEK